MILISSLKRSQWFMVLKTVLAVSLSDWMSVEVSDKARGEA
jgi:hypothetical protein